MVAVGCGAMVGRAVASGRRVADGWQAASKRTSNKSRGRIFMIRSYIQGVKIARKEG